MLSAAGCYPPQGIRVRSVLILCRIRDVSSDKEQMTKESHPIPPQGRMPSNAGCYPPKGIGVRSVLILCRIRDISNDKEQMPEVSHDIIMMMCMMEDEQMPSSYPRDTRLQRPGSERTALLRKEDESSGDNNYREEIITTGINPK